MIINRPTGLYKSQLPISVTDPTSIIYTISDSTPLFGNQGTVYIPDGIKDKPRPDRIYTPKDRRRTLGQLVFTTQLASSVDVYNGAKQYSIGQVLDFVDTTVPAASRVTSL